MLTNLVHSFQNSCALETGLSDFHKMTVTVLQSYLEKKQLKIISYRDFGKFPNNDFKTQILRDFSTLHISSDSSSLELYVHICIRALDIYAPKKMKYLMAKNSPFMIETIFKAVMDSTRLRTTVCRIRQNWNFCIMTGSNLDCRCCRRPQNKQICVPKNADFFFKKIFNSFSVGFSSLCHSVVFVLHIFSFLKTENFDVSAICV